VAADALRGHEAAETRSYAEVLSGDARAVTQALDDRPGEPIGFTERRQVHQLGGAALSAPEVDKSGLKLWQLDHMLRVAIGSRSCNEFPQSGHLGEGRNQLLGRAWCRDANPGRCNHDAVRLQSPEPEHRGGKSQAGLSEHRPILLGGAW
jgi:hypothetical protein